MWGWLAGYFAAQLELGRGYGAVPDMVVGSVGAIAAGYAVSAFALTGYMGRMGSLSAAAMGAVILLVILRTVAAARSLP